MPSVSTHPATAMARSAGRALRPRRLHPPAAQGPLGAPFRPFDPETIADPPAAYRRLHAEPGVHPVGRRVFALSSHADVRAAARAHDALASGGGVTLIPASLPMLLTLDRPRHDELRRIIGPHFTNERSASLAPRMRTLTERAIERMIASPGADAVPELAVPLPVSVIAWLLGIPSTDLDRLQRWSDGIVEGFHANGSLGSARRGLRSGANALALHRYMKTVFERLRREPGDDVISALLASQEGGALDDEELFWLSLMLLVAGNETTTNLIGSMLFALSLDPDGFERLRAEPELIGPAVEEALRWGSPIQGLYRTARSDYAVGPTTIPAGARVLLLFGAANRDPRKFADPDRFVIDRRPSEHLALGLGIHFCLGAHLARIEARVVLEELLCRVARLHPAGPIRWRDNPTVRGPSHLPLRLEPV